MDIRHEVDIATTPAALYAALTTPSGLVGWWCTEARAEPRVGAVNVIMFRENAVIFRVEDLEPGRRVVWSSQDVPSYWEGTRIRFDLTPRSDVVALRFTHAGFPDAAEGYGFFNYMWGHYVRSLKLLLETGTGEPFGSPGSDATHPLSMRTR